MDTMSNSVMSSVQQRTPTKRSKPNKKKKNNNTTKPIKVVYISNPMKVKTSASGFRALVQELTGQDAESPPDPSRYSQEPGSDDGDGGGGGGHQMDSENCLMKVGHDENDHTHTLVVPPPVDPNNCQGQTGGGSSMESFEPFDDVFTPQMIENISAFCPQVYSIYESPQVDQVVMQCNYIHQ